jgi:hypothetical protein
MLARLMLVFSVSLASLDLPAKNDTTPPPSDSLPSSIEKNVTSPEPVDSSGNALLLIDPPRVVGCEEEEERPTGLRGGLQP